MYITYFNASSNRNEIPYPLTYQGLISTAIQRTEPAYHDTVPMGVTVHLPKPTINATFVLVTNDHPNSDGGDLHTIGGTFYWVEKTTPCWLECTLWGAPTALCYPNAEFAWSRTTPRQDRYEYIADDPMLKYTKPVHTNIDLNDNVVDYAGVVITLTKNPNNDTAWWDDSRASMHAFTASPVSFYISNLDVENNIFTPKIGSAASQDLRIFCDAMTTNSKWGYVTRIQVIPYDVLSAVDTSHALVFSYGGVNLVSISAVRPAVVGYVGALALPQTEFPAALRKYSTVKITNYNTPTMEFSLDHYKQPAVIVGGSVENGVNLYITIAETDLPQDDYEPIIHKATVSTPDIIAYGDSYTAWYTANQQSFTNQQLTSGASTIVSAVGLIGSLMTAPVNPALALVGVVTSGASLITGALSATETHNQQQQAMATAKRGVVTMGISGKGYQCDPSADWLKITIEFPCVDDRTWNETVIRRYGAACSLFGHVNMDGFVYRAYRGGIARLQRNTSLCVTQDEVITAANSELSQGVVMYTRNPEMLYTYSPYR